MRRDSAEKLPMANDDLRVLKISSNKLILVLIRDAMLGVTFSGLMQSVA